MRACFLTPRWSARVKVPGSKSSARGAHLNRQATIFTEIAYRSSDGN